MKSIFKYVLVLIIGLFAQEAKSQSRKYISQFSFFQSYYNPGLTGYEGSAIRGFVRNQWGGFQGAPKTMFFSGEFDFAEMAGNSHPSLTGRNAASINLLFDRYGAFNETELITGYATRIRISESHNVRLGAGINYMNVRLDGTALNTEQQSDQTLQGYIGSFADMQILDFNIGIALTHENYYFSYGMHNVNRGRLSKGDNFMDGKPVSYIVQVGGRGLVSENLAIIGNAFYREQVRHPSNLEVNAKALFMNRLWLGGGHRLNYANNFQAGFVMQNLQLGYIYELPVQRSLIMGGTIHEFMVILKLFKEDDRFRGRNQIAIW
ncbi:PorP/SprF family type IX secretion system membrane protein [Litoribacter ruber]|uniref:PorP/SprF family type IX secretion system membrane protein n=1 Tax=Litoribacter ruber TaxID=702568 RepID=UPI001BDAAB54|nr:PorP/SprF family type IX secretion system membrane protein [Litoribacter ruber]MBT0813090.1 PorP/SprF family type IX secretion system membrane protein [Litoribacter ruber]